MLFTMNNVIKTSPKLLKKSFYDKKPIFFFGAFYNHKLWSRGHKLREAMRNEDLPSIVKARLMVCKL